MAKVTPVQRTKAVFKKLGLPIDNCQHWIAFGPNDPRRIKFKVGGMRKDLFSILDLIVIYPNKITGLQVCGSDFASHDKKILECAYSYYWIKAGGGIELWGWRQIINKDSPTKQKKWEPRIKKYSIGDFG